MEKPKVLMVDDDKNLGEQVKRTLEKRYEVFLSEDGRDILHIIQRRKPHVVLLDLHLPPDITSTKVGMDILRDLVDTKIESKVIVITGSNDRKDALTAIDMGVYDYINKPIDIDELEVILKRAVHIHRLESEARSLQQRLGKEYVFEGIVGSCPQMQQIFTIIRRVAPTNSTVLLQGETGTGKELIARAIHQQSFRKEGPFIVINCAAIPDSLLESELFGHERGSFTGAFSRKLGTIELAQGGTLFMDEIAELPLPLQPKLLRFLQGSEIQRIGGKEKIKADVRVIAASNRYLEEAVRMGSFRKDLYYRLKLIVIELPPLRDRGNDILLLAEHFLKRMNNGLRVKRLTSGAKRALMQ
ncbi:MAG TPA: response regulator, partial [Syntrophaceae bacterium]|nr:response regulator [Syntrophaceae bacterium]